MHHDYLSDTGNTGSIWSGQVQNQGKESDCIPVSVSQMLPQIFTLIPNFIIFKKIGIYNTYWAPILSNCTLAIPFSLMMMRAFFVGIPTEIDEAARIDGCNAFQSFIRVMLPMSANGLAVTFVFSFLFRYQDMMYSLTYVTDSAMWPVTTGIYNVVGRYGVEWCRAMAFGCMAVLPVILIFVFMQKYIVQGLTAGAVRDNSHPADGRPAIRKTNNERWYNNGYRYACTSWFL